METLTNQHPDAKRFNLYRMEELPGILFENQKIGDRFSANYSEIINSAKMDLPDDVLNLFNPVLMFEVREQKENFSEKIELVYIERSYTCFLSPAGNICILRYDSKSKNYYFMPIYGYYREVQNVSYHIRNAAKKESGISEPNKIGKFTEKKVLQWLQYCDMEIELNEKIVSMCSDKNAEIEQQINDFCEMSGGKVSRWSNVVSVCLPLFDVEFTHYKNEQYLNTKISFKGGLNDVLSLSK